MYDILQADVSGVMRLIKLAPVKSVDFDDYISENYIIRSQFEPEEIDSIEKGAHIRYFYVKLRTRKLRKGYVNILNMISLNV